MAMHSHSLHWLPVPEAFSERLAGIRDTAASPADRAAAARRLARHDLDFLQTLKLDRAAAPLLADPTATGLLPLRLAVLASHTVEHLVPAIRVAGLRRGLAVTVWCADYGQISQQILDTGSTLYSFHPDVLLLALDARAALPDLPLTADAATARETVAALAGAQAALWRTARQRGGMEIIQQTIPDEPTPLFGLYDAQVPASPAALLRRLNLALGDAAAADGVALLDLDGWIRMHGRHSLTDPTLWHQAKQLVTPAAAPVYGDLVGRTVAALKGRSAKCLVLDLDNTLWGGVLGDDGPEGIRLGQGDPVGEAFAAFQAYARDLTRRGVILAVSSKNEPDPVAALFATHPEMVLKADHVACFQVGWGDKATSLRRIAETLNIGLDALVFADDNPAERALIRRELPEVWVPELPDAPERFATCLAEGGFFEAVRFTADDAARHADYQANARRAALAAATTDMESYLQSLEMQVAVAPVDGGSLARVVQLLGKTNQFNLTTRRHGAEQVQAVMDDPRALALAVRVRDRFGDSGLISAVLARPAMAGGGAALEIDSWVMSCRVFGRRIEHLVLRRLAGRARALGYDTLLGRYMPTARNRVVAGLYPGLGFSPAGDGLWTLDLTAPLPPLPETHAQVIEDDRG